ncbi:hypothetical protein BDU57DRAFT_520706 [Ampelomyces quisqualis]|uniref:Uncharacterized protein n=1 Tax=Ampelomyces quisqualis TaxID=50730 RepID=A0A6A5QGU8_AMPQU|nr:hypothetical protein BDU57DRAFT_520706 [Ampelomyces quisqualis]
MHACIYAVSDSHCILCIGYCITPLAALACCMCIKERCMYCRTDLSIEGCRCMCRHVPPQSISSEACAVLPALIVRRAWLPRDADSRCVVHCSFTYGYPPLRPMQIPGSFSMPCAGFYSSSGRSCRLPDYARDLYSLCGGLGRRRCSRR